MSNRTLSLLWLATLVQSGCSPSDGEQPFEPTQELASSEQSLFPKTSMLWPQDLPIDVCWEDTNPARANEREWVRDQVARTWEAKSNVRFSGWGQCTASSYGIHIAVADVRPHVDVLGRELAGVSSGMTLNFTFQNFGFPYCTVDTQRETCIREIAVHEFGHALGFSHEQNRPDTDRTTCTKPKQGQDGDSLYGAWDQWSVMNYCNLLDNNDGMLSTIDEAGTRALYGTRKITNFGYESGSWRTAKHPRLVADVNDDNRDDVVGFGDSGVIVSLAAPTGGFEAPRTFITGFGYNQGWRVERHVRTLADVNADGRADIVAFGEEGVQLALSGSTRFYAPTFFPDFGYNQGWRVEQHVRTLADVNRDQRPDIIGFGTDGVWISLSQNGQFAAPQLMVTDFGYNQGWRVEQHVRTLADVNGDGSNDIVGFGKYGVQVALAVPGGFSTPSWFSGEFGETTGYRVAAHPRMLADVNLDGRADIVAFGPDGVRVALSGSTMFYPSQLVLSDMTIASGWSGDKHPRFVRDVSGDGRPDLVGFGDAGIYVASALGGSVFGPMQLWAIRYGAADSRLRNGTALPVLENVRGLGDFDGDGAADVFAFRANGLHTTDLTHHLQALPALSAAAEGLASEDVAEDNFEY